MNGEFVPYQQSLDMKSIGFDEPCLAGYDDSGKIHITNFNFQSDFKEFCLAPLYQQAFLFFRERYRLHKNITQYYGEHFYYKIEDMVHPRRFDEYPLEKLRNSGEYSSHIEAELECLKQLIKLTKNK